MEVGSLIAKLKSTNPTHGREVESWVVNTLKVRIIKNLDGKFETEGRLNLRRLFLVPIFDIRELTKKVEEEAPEMKTYYFKELFDVLASAERQFSV
jgi:hypothetical protein